MSKTSLEPKIVLQGHNWLQYKKEIEVCMQGRGEAGEEIISDTPWDYAALEPDKAPTEPWWVREFLETGEIEEVDYPDAWKTKQQELQAAASSSGAQAPPPTEPRKGPTKDVRMELYKGYLESCKRLDSANKLWKRSADEYKRDRGKIFGILYYSTHKSILDSIEGDSRWEQVRKSGDALGLHRLQQKHCQAANSRNVQTHVQDFVNFRWNNSDTVAANINRFEDIIKACTDGGHIFQASDKTVRLGRALPTKIAQASADLLMENELTDVHYEKMKERMRTLVGRLELPLTSERLTKGSYRGEDERPTRGSSKSDGTMAMAVATGKRPRSPPRHPRSKRAGRGRFEGGSKPAAQPTHTAPATIYSKQPCHNCGQFGCKKRACPRPISRCTECGQMHHQTKYCNDDYKRTARQKGYSAENPQMVPTEGIGKSTKFAFFCITRHDNPFMSAASDAPDTSMDIVDDHTDAAHDRAATVAAVKGKAPEIIYIDDEDSDHDEQRDDTAAPSLPQAPAPQPGDKYKMEWDSDTDLDEELSKYESQMAEVVEQAEPTPPSSRMYSMIRSTPTPCIPRRCCRKPNLSEGEYMLADTTYHFPAGRIADYGVMGHTSVYPHPKEMTRLVTPHLSLSDPMMNLHMMTERRGRLADFQDEVNRLMTEWENLRRLTGLGCRPRSRPATAAPPVLISQRRMMEIIQYDNLRTSRDAFDEESKDLRDKAPRRLQEEMQRATTRDVSDWASLLPRERRQQHMVLTEAPLNGYTSHAQMCEWLYWFPNWTPQERRSRLVPEYDLPAAELIPPAFLTKPYMFLFRWISFNFPELFDSIDERPNLAHYSVMLYAYYSTGVRRTMNGMRRRNENLPAEFDSMIEQNVKKLINPHISVEEHIEKFKSDTSSSSSDLKSEDEGDESDDDDKGDDTDSHHSHKSQGEEGSDRSESPPPPPPPPAAGSSSSDQMQGANDAAAASAEKWRRAAKRCMMVQANEIRTTAEYIYDTGAAVHILRDISLVQQYVRPVKKFEGDIQSYGGHTMRATHQGKVPGFGTVYIAEGVGTSLISGGELDSNGYEAVVAHKRVLLTHPSRSEASGTLRSSGLYELSKATVLALISESTADNQCALTYAVTASTSDHTPEQRKRAAEVGQLHELLNHPSDELLMNALDNSGIQGTHLVSADVRTWRELAGPCPACVAARTKKPHYGDSRNPPAMRIGEAVHVDTYKLAMASVGGNNILLISIDEYSDYMFLQPCVNGKSESVLYGLRCLIAHYGRYGHTIKTIRSDHDGVFLSCNEALGREHIQLKTTNPYQHSQRIERHIQTLLSRVRGTLHGLPYVLPEKLYAELFDCCARRMNQLPTTKRPTQSAAHMFEHEKLDCTKGIPPPFGALVMANQAGHSTQTALSRRSELGIVLGPSHTAQGSTKIYSIATKKVCTRKQFVLLKHFPADFPYPRQSASLRLADICTRYVGSKGNEQVDPERFTIGPVGWQLPSIELEGDQQAEPLPLRTTGNISEHLNESEPTRVIAEDNITDNNEATALDEEADTSTIEIAPNEMAADSNESEARTESAATPMEIEADNTEQTAPSITEPETQTSTAISMRRSKRLAVPNSWYFSERPAETHLVMAYHLSVKEALKGEHAHQTKLAVRDEIMNMINYRVGHYVTIREIPAPLRRNILHTFMFIKHKTNSLGQYERTKARLVGNGAHQGDHMYDLVYSATVLLSSVMLLLNIASFHWCHVVSYDVKGAFLHAEFEETDPTTFIRVSKEVADEWKSLDPACVPFVNEKGELLLQLDKFIYGLKQSPYKFQAHLVRTLTSIGYKQMSNDECVYAKRVSDDCWSYLSTHVDDILQVTNQQHMVDELKKALLSVYKEVTFHPQAKDYVGITILRDEATQSFHLSQQGQIKKVIDEYLPDDKKPNPRDPARDDIMRDSVETDTPVDRKMYLGLIMSLMYVARLTRPDILLPVTLLAAKSSRPTQHDWEGGLHVARYLRGTMCYGVLLQCLSLCLLLSCDSSFNTHPDGKSQTGFLALLGGARSFLASKSGKQKLVALSSTDAEILALVECVKFGVHIQNLLNEMGFHQNGPMTIEQDNESCIGLSGGETSAKRSKHIQPKLAYIKEKVTMGLVDIKYVPTNIILADVMTKPKHGAAFKRARDVLVVPPPADVETS